MKIDINHLAKLANLPLNEGEKEKLGRQLSSVLDYFKKLQELNTSDIEETSQVTGLENVLRDDEIKLSLPQEDVLKNTGQKKNGLFKYATAAHSAAVK